MLRPRPSMIISGVLALLLAGALLVPQAGAQPKLKPPATVAVASPVADAPATPQETTATFADWTLRCAHTAASPQICEVLQGVASQSRAVAQIAIGRPGKGQPLQLTILVPPSVSLLGPATLSTAHPGDPPMLDLKWQRCLPGGCMANSPLPDDLLRRIKAWTDPARIVFSDATGQAIGLPMSAKGLPQALDALAKAEAE